MEPALNENRLISPPGKERLKALPSAVGTLPEAVAILEAGFPATHFQEGREAVNCDRLDNAPQRPADTAQTHPG